MTYKFQSISWAMRYKYVITWYKGSRGRNLKRCNNKPHRLQFEKDAIRMGVPRSKLLRDIFDMPESNK